MCGGEVVMMLIPLTNSKFSHLAMQLLAWKAALPHALPAPLALAFLFVAKPHLTPPRASLLPLAVAFSVLVWRSLLLPQSSPLSLLKPPASSLENGR